MKQVLIVLIALVITLGCQKYECNCSIEEKMRIKNDSLVNSILNDSKNDLQNYWDRFDEPILNTQESESYRLSIIVLLYDFFKVYRIEKLNNQYNVHVKEYAVSTTTTYRKDSLVNSFTREVSKKQWDELKGELEKNCYWTMPVDIKEDDGWLDGSGWVLEGFNKSNNCTNSKYHFIYRHSPYATNDTSSFIKICEKFLELDSLNIREF